MCNKCTKIIEFYIPDLGYSFNYYEDDVNIIKINPNRYNDLNIIREIVRTRMVKEYELSNDEEIMYKRLITKMD
jgi:hypothetical protein